MIVKITFDNDTIMLFGNSYKPWAMQFNEYMCYCKAKPIKFESSKDKWIGWGGLKWCHSERFQIQLNKEGCQEDEPDNPNPRIYANMKFVENPLVKNKALKILKG